MSGNETTGSNEVQSCKTVPDLAKTTGSNAVQVARNETTGKSLIKLVKQKERLRQKIDKLHDIIIEEKIRPEGYDDYLMEDLEQCLNEMWEKYFTLTFKIAKLEATI